MAQRRRGCISLRHLCGAGRRRVSKFAEERLGEEAGQWKLPVRSTISADPRSKEASDAPFSSSSRSWRAELRKHIYILTRHSFSPPSWTFPLVCKHYSVSISTSEMRIIFWIGIVSCSLFRLDFVPFPLVSECSLRLLVSPLAEYHFHLDFSWLLVRIRILLWCC